MILFVAISAKFIIELSTISRNVFIKINKQNWIKISACFVYSVKAVLKYWFYFRLVHLSFYAPSIENISPYLSWF